MKARTRSHLTRLTMASAMICISIGSQAFGSRIDFQKNLCENRSLQNLSDSDLAEIRSQLGRSSVNSKQIKTNFIYVQGFLNEFYGRGNFSVYFLDMENAFQKITHGGGASKYFDRKSHVTISYPSKQSIETSAQALCQVIRTRAVKEQARYIVIGHSMGGAIAATLPNYCPELFEGGDRSPIRAVVAIQAVIRGSPIADSQFDPATKSKWQEYLAEKTARGAGGLDQFSSSLMGKVAKLTEPGMRSLTTKESLQREAQLKRVSPSVRARLFYVTSLSSKKDMAWHLKPSGEFMSHLGHSSDGLVPIQNQSSRWAGEVLFQIDGADHFDLTFSKGFANSVTNSEDSCKIAFAHLLLKELLNR